MFQTFSIRSAENRQSETFETFETFANFYEVCVKSWQYFLRAFETIFDQEKVENQTRQKIIIFLSRQIILHLEVLRNSE